MFEANPLAAPSLALSAFVLAAAGFLAAWQWRERRRRAAEGDLHDDAGHFARQDRRRGRGIAVMGLIGLACAVGAVVNPRAGRDEARLVFASWVAVGVLLVAMLGLALLDWLATFSYARRVRRDLAAERERLLESHRRPGPA